jgi:hypothetical protein
MTPSSLTPHHQLAALLDRWAMKARQAEEESIPALISGVISDLISEGFDPQRSLDDMNYLDFLEYKDGLDMDQVPWP